MIRVQSLHGMLKSRGSWFRASVAGLLISAAAGLSIAPASAQVEAGGFYARSNAQHTIGIMPLDPGADVAATAIQRQIEQAWPGYRVVKVTSEPAGADCGSKPYAAVLRISTMMTHELHTPTRIDVQLELLDCAGWPVDQWHEADNLINADPAYPLYQRLGLNSLFRFRTWMDQNPALALGLMTRGVAYDPHEGATYWYAFFKSNDGEMRLFVRPGGPAYLAGLRSNDILTKLDGRPWWQYGTFQTEARAYDGWPHTLEVKRGDKKFTIQLSEPYRG